MEASANIYQKQKKFDKKCCMYQMKQRDMVSCIHKLCSHFIFVAFESIRFDLSQQWVWTVYFIINSLFLFSASYVQIRRLYCYWCHHDRHKNCIEKCFNVFLCFDYLICGCTIEIEQFMVFLADLFLLFVESKVFDNGDIHGDYFSNE